jgi:hypothetical protein
VFEVGLEVAKPSTRGTRLWKAFAISGLVEDVMTTQFEFALKLFHFPGGLTCGMVRPIRTIGKTHIDVDPRKHPN